MKPQILSRRNAPIRTIGFLLLMTTAIIGCAILSNAYPVMSLQPILLTQDDLPTIRLTESKSEHTSGPTESSLITKCEQRWGDGQMTIYYHLFNATSTAQKAAWPPFPTHPNHRLEPNPKEVIGDATWRVKKGYIYFVKNNVVVHIMAYRDSPNQLQFARDVARKIEAKIDAVLAEK